MLQAWILFAEENAKDSGPSPFGMLPILFLIFAFFYFLIIMPAQRREKRQREELFNKLKKNDEVVLHSGIVGIVQTLRDDSDEVTIKLEGDAKARVLRTAIAYIKQPKAQDAAAASSSAEIQEKKV
jgi:preprotein translocase subunit YajC